MTSMPAFTVARTFDEHTGLPVWGLTVTDGKETFSAPLTVEAAVGVAEVVDAVLGGPVEFSGKPTTMELLVRTIHYAELVTELEAARAGLVAAGGTVAKPRATRKAPARPKPAAEPAQAEPAPEPAPRAEEPVEPDTVKAPAAPDAAKPKRSVQRVPDPPERITPKIGFDVPDGPDEF